MLTTPDVSSVFFGEKIVFLGGFSCFDGIKAWLDAPVKEPKKQPTDNKDKKLSVVLDKVL